LTPDIVFKSGGWTIPVAAVYERPPDRCFGMRKCGVSRSAPSLRSHSCRRTAGDLMFRKFES
jgi:hypothetical protein